MVLWDLIKPHKHMERKPEALLFPTDLTLIDDFRKTQRRAPLTKCCKKKQWYLDSPSKERKSEEEEEEEEGGRLWFEVNYMSFSPFLPITQSRSRVISEIPVWLPARKEAKQRFLLSYCSRSAELRLTKAKGPIFYFKVHPTVVRIAVVKRSSRWRNPGHYFIWLQVSKNQRAITGNFRCPALHPRNNNNNNDNKRAHLIWGNKNNYQPAWAEVSSPLRHLGFVSEYL